MTRSLRLLIVVPLLSSALASGCSSGTGGKVTGRVLLDGKPLSDAQVSFFVQDSVAAANQAITDAEGNFVIQPDKVGRTLAPGSYVVLITKYLQKDGTPPAAEDREMQIASGTLQNVVPYQYSSLEQPALTADIQKGDNNLPPFELRSR